MKRKDIQHTIDYMELKIKHIHKEAKMLTEQLELFKKQVSECTDEELESEK